ncbi:MAG: hypothetical protein V3V33_04580 [Candidatus Lokiarchaeia archaeon]
MKENPPKIIFTNKPSTGNINRGTVLTLLCREFINFVNIEGVKSVFSAYGPHKKNREYFMFAIKEGFIVNSSMEDIKHLSRYYKINSIGCEDFFEFLEINFYPIIINEEERSKHPEFNGTLADIYKRYQKSNFYGYSLKNFETFKDALINGFEDNREYQNANSMGIKTKKEYDKFKESGYKRYQDYLDAIKGGFEDTNLFYKAKQVGIPTYKKYKDFIEKGFKDMLDKVGEIEADAEEMYNNKQYEQVLQLRYLAVEKLSKIVYFKLFDKKITKENNLNLSVIIESIENRLKTKLGMVDELNKWRLKRNEIVHDHIKLEQGTADLANQFFIECMHKLKTEFDKLLLA